jgi:hypothetical protein
MVHITTRPVLEMLLKGCLHTHTTCSDGKMTPQAVADAYQERGYDFIAFTDHDYLLKPDYLDVYSRVKTEMIVFSGIEITVFVKGYLHISRIAGENDELYILNHLGEYGLVMDQIHDRLNAVSQMYPLDAVEITSKGYRHSEYEIPEIRYPKIASDDLHAIIGIGRAWVEVDATRRDMDSIIKAVKQGDFWNCYI